MSSTRCHLVLCQASQPPATARCAQPQPKREGCGGFLQYRECFIFLLFHCIRGYFGTRFASKVFKVFSFDCPSRYLRQKPRPTARIHGMLSCVTGPLKSSTLRGRCSRLFQRWCSLRKWSHTGTLDLRSARDTFRAITARSALASTPDFINDHWVVPDLICHKWIRGVCDYRKPAGISMAITSSLERRRQIFPTSTMVHPFQRPLPPIGAATCLDVRRFSTRPRQSDLGLHFLDAGSQHGVLVCPAARDGSDSRRRAPDLLLPAWGVTGCDMV